MKKFLVFSILVFVVAYQSISSVSCMGQVVAFGNKIKNSFCSLVGSSEKTTNTSPIVKELVWGKITVQEGNGSIKVYEKKSKDCILTPQGSQVWDWSKTNMHHDPGIQLADVQPFLNDGDLFILSCGMDLVLLVPKETRDFLEQQGKEVHVLQSQEAAKRYNELVRAGRKVVMLLHSTC